VEAVRLWKERREEIIGSTDAAGTIRVLQKEGRRTQDFYPLSLQPWRNSRQEGRRDFPTIAALVENYKNFYRPGPEVILSGHPVATKRFSARLQRRGIVATNLEDLFLGKINQARKGSFCGLEVGKHALSKSRRTADRQICGWRIVKFARRASSTGLGTTHS